MRQNEWDERYAASDRIWSGQPNHALVTEVSDLRAGRALDVGCGEGADAVWLAGRGWDVTALDVSAVALGRAEQHAAEAGVRVRWLLSGLTEADLSGGAQSGDARSQDAPAGGFDLVSAQYPALLHAGDHDPERVLLAAVAPGGTLLVVHHLIDADHTWESGVDPADYVSPADVADLLDPDWELQVHEQRPRHVTGGAGAHHTTDVVLRARRLR